MKKKEESSTEYTKGEFVVCIINSRASLTIGKEYKVIACYGESYTDIYEVYDNFKDEMTIVVENDNGESTWYDHFRFISKDKFRAQLINNILK
jgi:hypothetical protein